MLAKLAHLSWSQYYQSMFPLHPAQVCVCLCVHLTTYLDSVCSTIREEEISKSSRTRRSARFIALRFCCSSLVVNLEPLVDSSAPVRQIKTGKLYLTVRGANDIGSLIYSSCTDDYWRLCGFILDQLQQLLGLCENSNLDPECMCWFSGLQGPSAVLALFLPSKLSSNTESWGVCVCFCVCTLCVCAFAES